MKPANVLLSRGEEHAYITDFGLARNVTTSSGLTKTGQFVGTIDYVAPEQIAGRGVDARVDVYALGCLLYKLLVGEVPFPREAEAARLFAHVNDPVPPPSQSATGVPAALDDVVARAMEKAPDDRFPSAGDLGRAAQAALGGVEPTLPERTVATGAAATRITPSPPPGSPPPTRPHGNPFPFQSSPGQDGASAGRPRSRRPLAIAAGLVGLVAVAAIGVLAIDGGGGGGGRGRRVADAEPGRTGDAGGCDLRR